MDLQAKSAREPVRAEKPEHAGGEAALRSSTNGVTSRNAVHVRPWILVVEDQEDVRRMVTTALEIEGYAVDEASNAREGLRQLQRRTYHLILSDYAMPGGTGTWMLQEAARLGLMDHTLALILTAHSDVRELTDIPVINKPLDLDYFLEQVHVLLGDTAMPPAVTPPADSPHCIELVLYVSSSSAASVQAQRNVEAALAGVDRSLVKYSVIDLRADPLAGEADRITFTPTLVKRHPQPRTWMLGNLRNLAVLTDLLRASGIDPTR
jgi:two-component system response regulator GlrR